MNVEEIPFLDGVNLTYDNAAALIEMPPGLINRIKDCNSVFMVRFPILTREGYEIRLFTKTSGCGEMRFLRHGGTSLKCDEGEYGKGGHNGPPS